MAKGAFGQKQGALAMRWPKEEGSDFAGHHTATHTKGGDAGFFSALTPTTLLEWGGVLFGRIPRKTFRKLNRLAKAPQKKAIDGGGAFIFGV
jgi:hypothetical protein